MSHMVVLQALNSLRRINNNNIECRKLSDWLSKLHALLHAANSVQCHHVLLLCLPVCQVWSFTGPKRACISLKAASSCASFGEGTSPRASLTTCRSSSTSWGVAMPIRCSCTPLVLHHAESMGNCNLEQSKLHPRSLRFVGNLSVERPNHVEGSHLMKNFMDILARSVPWAAQTSLALSAAAFTSEDAGCHEGGSCSVKDIKHLGSAIAQAWEREMRGCLPSLTSSGSHSLGT